MEIPRVCDYCKSDYIAWRRDQRFCTRRCKEKYRNDRKPRLTSKSYKKADKARKKALSSTAKQIILGGLLGDGCLTENTNYHRYSLCHGEKQLKYLQWKKNHLSEIMLQNKPNKAVNQRGAVQYHYHSIAHPDLTRIYELTYPNGTKTVSRKWLDLLEPLGICTWYLDDGSFNHNQRSNQIFISTNSFKKEGNELIQSWLLEKWNVESVIQDYKSETTFSPMKRRFTLRINKTQVPNFISIIEPFVPKCMSYKLPR